MNNEALKAWLDARTIVEKDLITLLELWRNGPRKASERNRVFISTGSALLDNLTIAYLLEHPAAPDSDEIREAAVPAARRT